MKQLCLFLGVFHKEEETLNTTKGEMPFVVSFCVNLRIIFCKLLVIFNYWISFGLMNT